jgi:hypothetical protein
MGKVGSKVEGRVGRVGDMKRGGGVPSQSSEKRCKSFTQTRTRRRCDMLRWHFCSEKRVV